MHEKHDHRGDADASPGSTVDRRQALKVSGVVAAAAWVAPAILSLDAAAAQTSAPGLGGVSGQVLCGPFPFDGIPVELTGPGGTFNTVSSLPTGAYSFTGIPAGSYTLQAGAEPPVPVTITVGGNPVVDLQIQCA